MSRILILTQAMARDNLIDISIGEELEKLGHTVWVRPYVAMGRPAVLGLKPNIVVLPEARCEYTIDFCEVLKKMGIKIVIRRCEPMYALQDKKTYTKDELDLICSCFPYKDLIDLEIVWQKDSIKELINGGYNEKDKLVAAGGFAFGLYHNKKLLNDLYCRHEFTKRYQIDIKKKNMLIATAWDYADRNRDYSVPEAPDGHETHHTYYDRCQIGRKAYIELIRRLVETYSNEWNIMVKVHPAEHPWQYQRMFGKRVPVIQTDAAIEVLRCCDLLIHAGSTMALEMHLLNKPSLHFMNYIDGKTLNTMTPECKTIDEVIEKVKTTELNKSNIDKKAMQKCVKTFFGSMDADVYKRTAEAIDKVKPNEQIKIPMIWPKPLREYITEGVSKTPKQEVWRCGTCEKNCFVDVGKKVVKCPNCALALIKNNENNDRRL